MGFLQLVSQTDHAWATAQSCEFPDQIKLSKKTSPAKHI